MHATGVGKLHLMDYNAEQLEELKQRHGLPQYTSHTIITLEDLKKEIGRIRKQQYAIDDEECEEGVRCVAVPVRDYTGLMVAALSVSAPVTRLDHKRIAEEIGFLRDISAQASQELGWEPTNQSK
jgi:DNA-binding IclR family transcriptional regulator